MLSEISQSQKDKTVIPLLGSSLSGQFPRDKVECASQGWWGVVYNEESFSFAR